MNEKKHPIFYVADIALSYDCDSLQEDDKCEEEANEDKMSTISSLSTSTPTILAPAMTTMVSDANNENDNIKKMDRFIII